MQFNAYTKPNLHALWLAGFWLAWRLKSTFRSVAWCLMVIACAANHARSAFCIRYFYDFKKKPYIAAWKRLVQGKKSKVILKRNLLLATSIS